jgi:hypothetical protein
MRSRPGSRGMEARVVGHGCARGSEVEVARGGWSAPRSRRAGHGWHVEDGACAGRPMPCAGGGVWVVMLKVAR